MPSIYGGTFDQTPGAEWQRRKEKKKEKTQRVKRSTLSLPAPSRIKPVDFYSDDRSKADVGVPTHLCNCGSRIFWSRELNGEGRTDWKGNRSWEPLPSARTILWLFLFSVPPGSPRYRKRSTRLYAPARVSWLYIFLLLTTLTNYLCLPHAYSIILLEVSAKAWGRDANSCWAISW